MEAAVKKAEAKEAKARNELSKEEEKLEKKPNISKKRLEEKRVAHAESVKELEKVKTYLEESETVELFEEIIQQDWEIIYDGGSKEERFELHAAKGGVNTDRPHGYRHGGNVKFTEDDFIYAAKMADIGLRGEKKTTALRDASLTLEAIRRHEGNADSINTWDRAVLTFGPGLAAFGVLESVFERVAIADPAFFQAEIASLGIGIKNKAFVVNDAETGTIHEKEKAKNYIANSPVLLGALRRVCGKHEVRRQMIVRTFETSIKRALNWSFKVKGPKELTGVEGQQEVTVTWEALTEDVDKKLVGAAQTVIASFIHASGNSTKLQDIIANEVKLLCAQEDNSVSNVLKKPQNRVALVQLLVDQVRDNTWAKAINDTMESEVAPLKGKLGKK